MIDEQLKNTISFLATAVSSAVGVAPSFISARRIRDVTFPLTPTVIWTNPQFAGDVFPVRRRLQGGQTMGSVSFDIQIKVLTTAAASALSTTLASSTTKLATDTSNSLLNQGSSLSTALITVSVEPFTGATGNTGSSGVTSNGNSFQPSTQSLLEIAAPSFVGGILFSAIVFVTCYIFKRRSSSSIKPEEEVSTQEGNATDRSTNWSVSLDREESTHSQSKSINDKSRVEDPNLAIARIGAEYDTSSATVGDKMDALKAQQEAATQERIAQREALKARVARTKADEYKKLIEQRNRQNN